MYTVYTQDTFHSRQWKIMENHTFLEDVPVENGLFLQTSPGQIPRISSFGGIFGLQFLGPTWLLVPR